MSGRGRALMALAALLAGCAQKAPVTVAQVAVALTAADQVALRYLHLPPCPQAPGAPCRDPAIAARIRGAAAAAYGAVRTAEASGTAGDLSGAVAAVGALSAALAPAQ